MGNAHCPGTLGAGPVGGAVSRVPPIHAPQYSTSYEPPQLLPWTRLLVWANLIAWALALAMGVGLL